jgi:enoyl-CoA hydratase/carnithine racemase
MVRDLLLTGRSINASKALSAGLVSQIAAEGEALRLARSTAAQATKFDRTTAAAAKGFIKPLPAEELRREIDIFCELFTRPAVMEGLRKFMENTGPYPHQP